MVARGSEALGWVGDQFASDDPDRISDAGGVLRWIGAPADWEPWLHTLADALPDGEPADAIAAVIDQLAGPQPAEPMPASDQLLLGGTHQPFTEPIWFINASFERVVDAAVSWLDARDHEYGFKRLHAPLPVMLDRLEPWSMPSWKQLLVATTGNWTALFSQGSDVGTANVIGGRLNCLSLRTSYQPRIVRDGKTISHGDCALWINNGSEHLRSIQANFESRWTWQTHGDPQPFEDLDAYTARRIPDRFTLDRLNQYCRALGIDRDNAGFYRPAGMLIEHDLRTWARPPTNRMSSAAWRATHA